MNAEPPGRSARQAPRRRVGRGRRSGGARKILVVNDHVEVRSVITEFLRRRGLIAIPVRDADSARVICERVALDLILLHMTGLDAPESALIQFVRRSRPTTPIVVISAAADDELVRSCQTAGTADVLSKPLVLKQLDRVITRLLRASRATEF